MFFKVETRKHVQVKTKETQCFSNLTNSINLMFHLDMFISYAYLCSLLIVF